MFLRETRASSSYSSICLMSLNRARSSRRPVSYLWFNSQPCLILTNRGRRDLEQKSLPRVGSREPSCTSVSCDINWHDVSLHRDMLNKERQKKREKGRERLKQHIPDGERWAIRRRHHRHMRERGGIKLTLWAHQRFTIKLTHQMLMCACGVFIYKCRLFVWRSASHVHAHLYSKIPPHAMHSWAT